MQIIINPGSGPVDGATEENAASNVTSFVADLAGSVIVTDVRRQPTADGGDGRYGFVLTTDDGREIEVDMPGLPLAQVRYVGDDDQNIWDFPRLYVDGSSWVWQFALGACQAEEEDE